MTLPAAELDTNPDNGIIRNGRYQIWLPDATKPTPHTRATNFVAALDNSYGLTAWKQRQTAIGIARSHALRTELLTVLDNPTAIDQICERALSDAGANEKRDLGSQLHRLTELIDEGAHPDLDPDDPLTALADQYLAVLDTYQLKIVDTEAVVVLNQYTVAGRYDRIVNYRGNPTILDIKTGRIKPGSCARQLAVYAHADTIYDPATRTHTPMVDVDQQTALILHLPYDAPATLHEVDIAAGWDDVHLCAQVRDRGHRQHNELVRPAARPDDTVIATPDGRPFIITRHDDDDATGDEPIDTPTTAAEAPAELEPLEPSDDDDPRPAIQARIDAIKPNPNATAWLRKSWPANARQRPWPAGQLAAIERLVAKAERLAGHGPDYWRIQQRVQALTPDARTIAQQWARQAADTGHTLTTGDNTHDRMIVDTMAAILEQTIDEPVIRTIIEIVAHGEKLPANTTIGAKWLCLTDNELDAVHTIAQRIAAGEITIDTQGETIDGRFTDLLEYR